MKGYFYAKNVRKNYRTYTVKNVNSICVRNVINKIHNKGARKKHYRFPKNKIEPFFLMNELHEEQRDQVPTIYSHAPLHSIMENEDSNSREHDLDSQSINDSSDQLSTPKNLIIKDPARLQQKSLPSPGVSISTPENITTQEKRNATNPLYNNNFLSYPLALKTSKSAQSRDDFNEHKGKDRGIRQKSDSLINTVTVTCTSTNIDTSLYCTKKQQVVIPVYQPFIKVDKKIPAKVENHILEVQKILRAFAEDGNLMIENRELINVIADK